MAATVTYEKILIVTISFRLMRKISKNVGEYIKSVKMLEKLKEIIIRLKTNLLLNVKQKMLKMCRFVDYESRKYSSEAVWK